jgi:lysophospholipase L1-like esterase
MRIIAFGSSHTVGYGLSDVVNSHYKTVSKFAYPNIIAQHFDCPVVNYAKCSNPMEQMHLDILSYFAESRDDDFIIVQVSTNPSWTTLINPDNDVVFITNPDSLNKKGSDYKKSLHGLYGTLTSENHWNRIWYLHFYSIMNLLHYSNKKFIWFFDRFSSEYDRFNEVAMKLPPAICEQVFNIRNSCPSPEHTRVKEIYANYLGQNFNEWMFEDGHFNESAHMVWANHILIPEIEKRLTGIGNSVIL